MGRVLVGCGICPILDVENVLIGVRMYLHDRFYPRFFIGGIDVIVWVCLLVDLFCFIGARGRVGRLRVLGIGAEGCQLNLGWRFNFFGLFYVFGIGCAFPPFVWTSV